MNQSYEVWNLSVTNKSDKEREICIFGYAEFTNNSNYEQDQVNLQYSQFITRTVFRDNRVRQMIHANLDKLEDGKDVDDKIVFNRFFGLAGAKVDSWCGDKEGFLGRYHGYGNPQSVIEGELNGEGNYNGNACGALSTTLHLAPGETKEMAFLVGMKEDDEAGIIVEHYKKCAEVCQKELEELIAYWHRCFARRAAEEGIVLLKNDRILPIAGKTPIALLGSGAGKTVKGGIGSGDVNDRGSISIFQGIKESGAPITSINWLEDYENRYRDARNEWKEKILKEAKQVDNPFDAYAANPFTFPIGRAVCDKDLDGAQVAIYVVSRVSGEGKDRRKEKGDYYLSDREQEDLKYIDQKNIPIVTLLNAGGPVELTEILEQTNNIKAVVNISQLGQEGGRAVANILFGKAVPSGKLTTTWAKRYEDYPSAESFSYLNGNLETEEYKEGIYVGYRYFDSAKIKPLFPFGYGLSYTTLGYKYNGIKVENETIKVEVIVENKGKIFSGKEVIQIYATMPQSGMQKEYHRLVGFAKTRELKPGQTQKVLISIDQKTIACFSEETHTWIVEAGNYGLWIGNSSINLKLEAVLHVLENTVIEQTECLNMEHEIAEELKKMQQIQAVTDDWYQIAKEQKIPVYEFCPQFKEQSVYKEEFDIKQTTEELIPLLYGNISETTSTLGAAGIKVPGSAGETTEALYDKYGIPALVMADGPAGIRLQ